WSSTVHPGSKETQVPACGVPGGPRFAIFTPSKMTNRPVPSDLISIAAPSCLVIAFSSPSPLVYIYIYIYIYGKRPDPAKAGALEGAEEVAGEKVPAADVPSGGCGRAATEWLERVAEPTANQTLG